MLSSSNINTTDPDNTPAQLTYTASNVTGGHFELVAAPGVAITSFTQAQINAGAVQFVHDGGEAAPSYSLAVSDGTVSAAPSPVVIGTFTHVNDASVVTTNTLTVSEGGTVVLSSSNINTTDPDNTPAQLTYTASNVTGGNFEFVAAPGVAITSFTQAQINASAVQFVHDGGGAAPSYSLAASDGTVSAAPSPVVIGTFTHVNDAPVILADTLTVSKGGTVVLSSSNIDTVDPDNTPAQLTYMVGSATGGRFELVAAPGVAITSFTQAQINAGAVQFVHDGGEAAPSYSLGVGDGTLSTAPTLYTNSGIGYGTAATANLASSTAGLRYAFSVDTNTTGSATYANSGTSNSVNFGILNAGDHTVYARIIDKDGGSTLYTATLHINKASISHTIGNAVHV